MKQISGGSFQAPNGTKIRGTLHLQLSHQARAISTGQIAPTLLVLDVDANGNIVTQSIWANDELTPTGTTYTAVVKDTNGARVWGPARWALIGSSPIDLGLMTPTDSSDGIAFPDTSSLAYGLAGATIQNTAPSPLGANGCPSGQSIFVWMQNADGDYIPQASIDNTTATPSGNAPAGTLNWCRRMMFNTSGDEPTAGKNNAFNFFHVWGDGGVQPAGTNGAAVSIFTRNTGDQKDFSGTGQLVNLYVEGVYTGNDTVIPSGPEPAISGIRSTLADQRTGGTLGGGSGGIWAYSSNAVLSTNGTYGSCAASGCFGAVRGSVNGAAATGNHSSDIAVSFSADGNFGVTSATNLGWAAYVANAPTGGHRWPFVNIGFWSKDFGTSANDYNFRSDGVNASGTASGFNAFVGPTSFGALSHAGAGIQVDVTGTTRSAAYATATNCANAGGTCGSASAGRVSVAAGAITVTVATTAVTANSEILVFEDSSLGAALGVTCNTTLGRNYGITARTAGTSFVITTDAAPVTNPACLGYKIIN